MVNLEKRVREETQSTLVRLVGELESNLGKEIKSETDERVENEESFMELLEQTCSRIEIDMQHWNADWTLFRVFWSVLGHNKQNLFE